MLSSAAMKRGSGIGQRAALAAVVLGVVALGGCQRDAARSAQQEETEVFTRVDELPLFQLEPMSIDEMGDFEPLGDKRCSFATNPALGPLVVATGFLRRPTARVDVLVKYGGQIVQGRTMTEGGFDAILDAATFDTGGMVIDVARIDVEPDGSGPAPPGRALLRMTMAGQEQDIIEGYWLCSV